MKSITGNTLAVGSDVGKWVFRSRDRFSFFGGVNSVFVISGRTFDVCTGSVFFGKSFFSTARTGGLMRTILKLGMDSTLGGLSETGLTRPGIKLIRIPFSSNAVRIGNPQ
ncbi:MAG: hypothetical protein HN945_08720 [Deltaproteobacteria bacterium]|nr:hypothetical protein [Deltaproteobacteria bacterium]MBT4640409.1 hypothetical protein [Deltaproteobacteria bacterium]MBT7152522.1 hypothetical protein [Deltaproteobacteria bacterium]MBT7715106.1 hypothetical protein [Deltaproteobacteria bacterium]